MISRICLVILLLVSYNGAWNPIYNEKIQPEVVKKPPVNEAPPPEQVPIYYSVFMGGVFGMIISSGFFFCSTKYYKSNDIDSRPNHKRFTVTFEDDLRKEAHHPTNHVSEATGSIHLITNEEIVSPEDILVDPSLESDPTGHDSQPPAVADSTLEETLPVSLPTGKETETDCKSKSLSNFPRDTPAKPNDSETKRVRSLSLARRQAKIEASPVRIQSSPSDATTSDSCSCKSKMALDILEKEVEDLRKSMNNAERMKRESMRALSSLKKEMVAMGTSIKEMGKEKDKQREVIDALKKEKKESVRVANARWRQKLMQLQETMKMELRSEFSKCELSSGSRESASGKSDTSPGKRDFTPVRGGLARDTARAANDMRGRDSRANFRTTRIVTKSSSPMPTMILPAFFEDPKGKDLTERDVRCENSLVNQNREESKSEDTERDKNCNEDVREDDRRENCQDGSRDGVFKGNDVNKNSHTVLSNGVKDIKQDTVPSITDNKVHTTTDREVAMMTETTKMRESDSKAEGSKVKLKGETSELEVVEKHENQGGIEEIAFEDKSEMELIDFDFDFGEDETVRNDSDELDNSLMRSHTFSVSKTEISHQEHEGDETNEEEIDPMNSSEDKEKIIPEVAKAEEADATSKLETVIMNAEDSDDKSKSPSISSKETDESPEVKQDSGVANTTDNVKKCAIPRPIAQQKLQKSISSKSYSVFKDNQKDSEDYVKSSTPAVIPARKSATAVATALLRSKPPKPSNPTNKQRRTRNDSSLVRSLLTRPSTSGCAIGDKVGSSFVTVTKNVCVLKTVGPDAQLNNNADKENGSQDSKDLKEILKSSPDSNSGKTSEEEIVEQNVVDEENHKPVTDVFHSENLFWVKYDEGRKNNTPSSDKEKNATKAEKKPDPSRREEKEAAKQGYTDESFDRDTILTPDTMEKNASAPKTIEITDDLRKCKIFTAEAERCMQNIISLGPSFTEEDKATLEFLLDRLNPVDDFRQLASFNDSLESVAASNSGRKHSLDMPEKSNSECMNAAHKSERQPVAMRSASESTNGKREDSESTKGLAEKLSRYFVYDPERLAESFLTQVEDGSSEE